MKLDIILDMEYDLFIDILNNNKSININSNKCSMIINILYNK